VILFPEHSAFSSCSWTGTWDVTITTEYYETSGQIHLEKNGSQANMDPNIYSLCERCGEGLCAGTVSGDSVRFVIYSIINGECVSNADAIWMMQPDCNHFTGHCEWKDSRWKDSCVYDITGVRVEDPNQPPEVDVSYSPILPSAGKLITFTADASDPDGDELEYSW